MGKTKPHRNWTQQTLKMKKDHGWRAKPGHKIFIADRGAVRFDIPDTWVVKPGDDSIRFTDKEPPDDDCILQLSVMYLRADIDWSGLSLRTVLDEIVTPEKRAYLEKGPILEETRSGLNLAWLELLVMDRAEHREAFSRMCYARSTQVKDVVIQPLITMDFWPEHAKRFTPVWDEVLRSLTLGDWVEDPTRRILH